MSSLHRFSGRSAVFGLVLAIAAGAAAEAQTVCRSMLTGTTICSDGTVTRTNLHGTRFDSERRVWRSTLHGFELSSDSGVGLATGGAGARLRDADGRLWNTDPFPAAAGAVGGVGCDTARVRSSYCR